MRKCRGSVAARLGGITIAAWLLVLPLAGCRRARPEVVRAPAVRATAVEDTGYLRPQTIGAPAEGHPWIAHVNAVDLDRDGRIDVLVCDAEKNSVVWLRQGAPGRFEETTLAAGLRAPVHAEAVDFDGDGDLDVLVACMGQVFPNNDRIGSVIALENDGAQRFTPHVLLERVSRACDVQAGDFNGDGRLDLAVAHFGYDQGEIRWMERTGPWELKSHLLLELSGGINVCLADFNGDHTLDIAALISQQWEEIYLFSNDGAGNFASKAIYGSTNEDYGSSNLVLCDLNRDGRPDLLYSNGDGFDLAQPGPRPWHGVQWLENVGNGFFYFHRIGDLPGAYGPSAADIDGDGAVDVIAASCFADWKNPRSVSLMFFRNDGRQNFVPHVLARSPTHLLTTAVADFDGDGRLALVTGGFHAYPPYGRMSRLTLWRRPER